MRPRLRTEAWLGVNAARWDSNPRPPAVTPGRRHRLNRGLVTEMIERPSTGTRRVAPRLRALFGDKPCAAAVGGEAECPPDEDQ